MSVMKSKAPKAKALATIRLFASTASKNNVFKGVFLYNAISHQTTLGDFAKLLHFEK